mmetsp:Transcript_30061/g.54821  ORF Transcript_30061/g.54821 Transcript_30061/m.54821 type:complete len:145 (+) Transcript_30061:44-478(+)
MPVPQCSTVALQAMDGHSSEVYGGCYYSNQREFLDDYYHYTDAKGAAAIQACGMIKPSTSGACGPGIYVTDLCPYITHKWHVIVNNYLAETDHNCRKADKVVLRKLGHETNPWKVVFVREHVFKIVKPNGEPANMECSKYFFVQ